MKFIYTVFLSLALFAGSTGMTAQVQPGSGYFLHTITKGQSLYSIASMYNVSIDDIVRLNPESKTQIRAGETLKIPQDGDNSNGKVAFHTIQSGETLYQLTVKYNVTAQAICAANPGLSAKNFRIGQVIAIPAQEKERVQAEAPAKPQEPVVQKQTWKEMHKVQRKETIFSISWQYGITEEELIAANPELKTKKLKRGTFLFIPYPKSEQQQPAKEEPREQQVAAPTNEELFSRNKPAKKAIKTIKAALVLPFTSGSAERKEEQTRMVEFYEGFLMAVDSLKKQGVSIDLYTFDSKGSAAAAQQLLLQDKLKGMDVVFGPVSGGNIRSFADYAHKNDIRLVVPFSPKVDEVFTNPNVYQINTPQSYLYSEVYEHFLRKFGKTNVVFLEDGSGNNEKAEFIAGMKNELKDNGVKYKQIRLEGEINPDKVIAAMDTLRQNIFVPTSGANTALVNLLPHLTLVRKEHPHFDMHLFGYPEWQTYTQEHLASFYELDTYFYSSFYTNNLFPAAVGFTREYRHWYSKDMANTFPKYGMLGFDIGYFFLKGLSQQGNKLEDNLDKVRVTPIQTGFKFERVNNWGGFINRKVFFVHFTKDFELIKIDFE